MYLELMEHMYWDLNVFIQFNRIMLYEIRQLLNRNIVHNRCKICGLVSLIYIFEYIHLIKSL